MLTLGGKRFRIDALRTNTIKTLLITITIVLFLLNCSVLETHAQNSTNVTANAPGGAGGNATARSANNIYCTAPRSCYIVGSSAVASGGSGGNATAAGGGRISNHPPPLIPKNTTTPIEPPQMQISKFTDPYTGKIIQYPSVLSYTECKIVPTVIRSYGHSFCFRNTDGMLVAVFADLPALSSDPQQSVYAYASQLGNIVTSMREVRSNLGAIIAVYTYRSVNLDAAGVNLHAAGSAIVEGKNFYAIEYFSSSVLNPVLREQIGVMLNSLYS
jgi:hypothetical protein